MNVRERIFAKVLANGSEPTAADMIFAKKLVGGGGGGVTIVPWSTGTDEEIVAMLQAAHAGTIDLQTDGGWAVGDTRTIRIGAWTGGGNVAYAEQDADIIITSFDEYMSSGNVLQFDFKNPFSVGQRLNSSNSTSGGYGAMEIKTTTLPALVEALPTWLKNSLVEFSVLATDPYVATKAVEGNKLAIRSYVELTGSMDKAYSPGGVPDGTQLAWYNTAENKRKNGNSYWLRSISSSGSGYFIVWAYNSTSYRGPAMASDRIAPFGCL